MPRFRYIRLHACIDLKNNNKKSPTSKQQQMYVSELLAVAFRNCRVMGSTEGLKYINGSGYKKKMK